MQNLILAANPGLTIPPRHKIGDELLYAIYNEVEQEILKYLDGEQLLNFNMDESTDNARHRVITLAVNIPDKGSFTLCTKDIGSLQEDSRNMADWFLNEAIKWTKGGLAKVNSICFDTTNPIGQLKISFFVYQSSPRALHYFAMHTV